MSIERSIIRGLIVSVEFIQEVRPLWDTQLLKSPMATRLSGWCVEYFDKYHRAPGRDIEGIYYQKLEEGLPTDVAEEIEQDILPGLSDEHEREQFNLAYLLDQTHQYFKHRHLELHAEHILGLLEDNEVTEAELHASDYHALAQALEGDLNLASPEALERIDRAFSTAAEPVVRYPRALGDFWNSQLVRGAFVALMAAEKRGKSYWLLDLAFRGHRQGANVAFFQAGDMTEDEQIIRMCEYISQRSADRRSCTRGYAPVRDCRHNQLDTCDREERACDHGVVKDEEELRGITLERLRRLYRKNPDYSPCHHCSDYEHSGWGVPWVRPLDVVKPLTAKEARTQWSEFFKDERHFKLSTHANGTLSVEEMAMLLDVWERQYQFVPDLIIVDYADLLVTPTRTDFRHTQNEIWKGLRRISQERHALVVTATQADADSYERDRLRLKNFSEDKRKYAHVTAMYGLNQDKRDREKEIGLMRINELVKRRGAFSNLREVTVLQNLRRGRPFISSYI